MAAPQAAPFGDISKEPEAYGESARVARRKPKRSSILLRWLAIAAIVLVALLYARPLRSYLGTKHDLAQKAADVQALKAENREFRDRLATANTTEALQREAGASASCGRASGCSSSRASPPGSSSRTTINRGG